MAWPGLEFVLGLVYGSCCRCALAGRTTTVVSRLYTGLAWLWQGVLYVFGWH